MGHLRDDSSIASLIHKSALTITEDDATTIHDGLSPTINGLQMGRGGMLEHCECDGMSCQNREM